MWNLWWKMWEWRKISNWFFGFFPFINSQAFLECFIHNHSPLAYEA